VEPQIDSQMLAEVTDVKNSYGRAMLAATFFDDFYDSFLASSPSIKPMFANTDLKKQKGLLREGITFLLMFAADSPTGKRKVDALASTHSRAGFAVKPEMYQFWVDSLVKVVKKHDASFVPGLDGKWRRVLEKGISRMKQGY